MTANAAYWRYLFWPQLAGVVFLIAGFAVIRRRLSFHLDDLTVLARVFVPVPLAIFGAEHLASANFMKDMVPNWIPGHLFWIYFVGLALFAAAISILTMKYVRFSAMLLGTMFFLFVAILHVPNAIHQPLNRFTWAVAARDLSFGLGAWMLAASQMKEQNSEAGKNIITSCRIVFGLILIFFAVEHLLHPQFTPGVPLPQEMPTWIPLRFAWGYLIGIMLLMSGIALLVDRFARQTTTWLGVGVMLVVLFINTPMLAAARQPSEINTGVNYVGDTLLFAGMIFLVASAIPAKSRVPALVQQAA